MKGRKPKPRAQKELEGNPGKRALPDVIEFPKPKACPKPPAGIGKWARQFWKSYAPGLHAVGLLTDVDVPAWTRLCESFQRYRTADEKRGQRMVDITEHGSKKSPYLAIIHQELAAMEKWMAKFGMTPLDRERLHPDEKDEGDEYEKLMQGRGN